MTNAIDTTRVSERRTLHFACPADVGAEVERLAQARELRVLGNWSSGQIVQHLALTMNMSVDSVPPRAPWYLRLFVQLFFKRRFLTKTMAAGFQLPASAAMLLPPPISLDEAVQNFRTALHKIQTDPRRIAHPVLGTLTRAEWDQLHCRHAELHLSFLVPIS